MSQINDTYLSIAAPSEGLFKDQGSRFLAQAFPVESEREAREYLERARKEFHDARHHCLAYRIGHDGKVFRASDDGEPSGSAGRPIIGQIDSAGLSDVAVVVTRWFGGIKLGIPGLIRAYKESTADAIAKAEKIQKIAGKTGRLEFGYDQMPQVMKIIKDMDVPVKSQNFDQNCTMAVRIRLRDEELFLDRIKSIATFIYEDQW